MSEIQIYLQNLEETFSNSDGNEAKRIVAQIHALFKVESLTQLEIDSGITSLLNSTPGKSTILQLLESHFMKPNFKDALGSILEFISNLLNDYETKISEYVKEIIPICLKILRSSCLAEVKLKSMLPLCSIVSNVNWSQHVDSIADLTVNQIVFKKNTSNVLNKQLFLLGILCERHPEVMMQHSARICSTLMNLVTQDTSAAKINFTTKEGMFLAVKGYMTMADLSPDNVIKVYKCIKMFADPRDAYRKGFARGAISLLGSKPGKVFAIHVCDDLMDWLRILPKFVSSTSPEDRSVGCVVLCKVYEYIGVTLKDKGSCDYSLRRLQYLLTHFKDIISNYSINRELEYKLAVEGFAVIISECKDLIGDEEFRKITQVLIHRARLVLKDEEITQYDNMDDEQMDRIDKICMYCNTLHVLGPGAKDCLTSLVKVLISEYPHCPINKRTRLMFTLTKYLLVADLQLLIPYTVKESCRHSISLRLQHTLSSNNWRSYSERRIEEWTYEDFMDLWKGLLESCRGEQVFTHYMEYLLKTLLNLDFSTKSIPNDLSENSDMEEIQMPNNSIEYSFFVNLCDLTSTILDLFIKNMLCIEWCQSWLYKLFSLVVQGFKKNPLATSLLKVAQSVLVVAKKLKLFCEQKDNDIINGVMQLYQLLCVNKSSGFHQLRCALFVLQTPHQILNEFVLNVASDAFEVVLRNGRNNLELISETIDILDEWDSFIDRDSFRPLCIKVLPTLNEYLCSSGISDGKILDQDASVARRYEYASRRRRMVLTQGTNQQLETVQHKILRFIGKMDEVTLQTLLLGSDDTYMAGEDEDDGEDTHLTDLTTRLIISLPCPQQKKIDIYLDTLIPRIKDLSLSSTNRDTRVTACQLLHSILLLTYGTHRSLPQSSKASLTNILSELTSIMLLLSADTDLTITDMFDPLLTESCHWFTSPMMANSLETEKFLMALMKGAFHPSNSLVREKACLALKEVVSWSVRQSSDRDLQSGPVTVAAILRCICQGIVHVNAYRKRGAFLIFNNIASQVYRIDSIIDKFLPELICLTVTTIHNGHIMLDDQYVIYKQEAMDALNLMLKCLLRKTKLFKKYNKSRRKPSGFGECCLKDIVLWIYRQTKHCDCRVTTNRLFKNVSSVGKQLDGATEKDLITNVIKSSKFLEPTVALNSAVIKDMSFSNAVQLLMNQISNFDCYIMYGEYISDDLKNVKSMESLDFLLNMNTKGIIKMFLDSNNLTEIQRDVLQNLLFKLYWKVFEMLSCSETKCVSAFKGLVSQMCSYIIIWLLDYDLWIILSKTQSSEDILSTKRLLLNMKENFAEDEWNLFVRNFVNYDKKKLIEIFGNYNEINITMIKYLNHLIDMYEIINTTRLYTELMHCDTLKIFKDIFDSNQYNDSTVCIVNFLLNCDILKLPDIMDVLLSPVNDGTHVDNFLMTHQENFRKYFTKHYVDILQYLEEKHECNVTMVIVLLKHFAEKKCTDECCIQYLINWIIKVWSILSVTLPFDTLMELVTLAAIVSIVSLYHATTVKLWVLQQLCNTAREMTKRTKLIYLLGALYKPSNDTVVDDQLMQALSSVTSNFPQKSNEFVRGSSEREEFLSAYKALLETMANSGNLAIFQAIVNTSCVDKEHVCDKQISHKLKSLMERLSPQQSFVFFDWVYDKFLSKSCDPSIRMNLLIRFLEPMLRAASIDALELFYGEHILGIVSKLEKEINTVRISETPLNHLFVEWNSSFILADVMFSKIPDSVLKSSQSKIGAHNKKLRSVFIQKCLKVRNVSVPACDNQSQVLEYLRICRCSAYKCMHCIVITSPEDGEISNTIKKYECLLNNTPDSTLWEGMIDTTKKYTFPLDQICHLKHHSVKTKKSTSPICSGGYSLGTISQSLSMGVLSTEEERRKMMFSQTLQDDILKYDLNMATIRDVPTNLNTLQDQVVLEFEDTDLLNHEILATVCCVMKEMDRITCPAPTAAGEGGVRGGQQHITPAWIHNLAAVMANRRRDNNVRLFLSQVMVKLKDNNTDIFKKYSGLFMKPLLHIIHDRCTGSKSRDENFNFWDVGIILLLLSWGDISLPSTPDEILSANFILESLIRQINPNLQSPELFKYSLELLKDLLNVWGKHLTIPSDAVISKLQPGGEKLLSAGIQVTAVILASQCQPWNSDVQFDIISSSLINLMNNNDGKIYKPTSEVIGLMLQLLHNNMETNQSTDVDMDSKDYSKYVNLLNQSRKKISEFKSNKGKFISCLYMVRKYHAHVCDDSLMDFILYLIPKLPIHTKKMCYKIYLSAVEFLDKSWLQYSLVNIDIKSYLKDKDLGVTCLHIVNKLMDKMELNTILVYLEDICSIGNFKESESRSVVYEILMKAYDALSSVCDTSTKLINNTTVDDKSFVSLLFAGSSRKRGLEEDTLRNTSTSSSNSEEKTSYYYLCVKDALLCAMEDENDEFRDRICQYWAKKLDDNLQERWLYILSHLHTKKENINQGSEMERTLRLLLEACKKAPDYDSTKLFDTPLENCVFTDYNLNDKKTKDSSLLAPMFAETINSHHQLVSLAQSLQNGDIRKVESLASHIHSTLSSNNSTLLNQPQFFIRATLDSLTNGLSLNAFDSLRDPVKTKQKTMESGFSFQEESSLLFTLETPILNRKTYQPMSSSNQRDEGKGIVLTSEDKLRRRLIANKNIQKSKFAAIAMEKNIKKQQKRLSNKPAPIFRSFRKGDYPDIQISLDSIIAPMLGLANRDPIFSKDLFIVVFKSLLSHCPNDVLDDFKNLTSRFIIQQLKNRTIPLTVEALMEICRESLKEANAEVSEVIRSVSKNNGLEWLGELVLEEMVQDGGIERKRIKLEEGESSIICLPKDIRSSIRSLRWNNQWEDLQNLYQEATGDERLNDIEKLHCIEEYFGCFSHLSDWNGLMNELKDHLSPDTMLDDDTFTENRQMNMDLLWASKYRSEAYLHLVFMAHIHMRARVDCVYDFTKPSKDERKSLKDNIVLFNNYVNKWIGESDKSSVLEGRLSPLVCVWRSVCGDHSTEGCNGALNWLRHQWTRDWHGATHTARHNTLDAIQLIAENRNYLDLVVKISNSANEDVIGDSMRRSEYSWKYCIPEVDSHTVAWDLRMACRSIYTSQLQNILKSKLPQLDDSEKLQLRDNLTRIQKHAELCLTKAALNQKNYHLAKKLLNKHTESPLKDDEKLSWHLERMHLMMLAADREKDLGRKISGILDAWHLKQDFPHLIESSEHHIGILKSCSDIADMLCSVVMLNPWENTTKYLQKDIHKLENHIAFNTFDKEQLMLNLIEYSSSNLMECVRAVETSVCIISSGSGSDSNRLVLKPVEERKLLKHKAQVYMNMVHYCRKAKQDYLNDEPNETLLRSTIIGILKTMKLGDMEARKLFPVLLLDLEGLPEDHHLVQLFMDEVVNVPVWMFLWWCGQLLGFLPSLPHPLLPLLTSLAHNYPSALRHHYHLSRTTWEHLPHMKDITQRLDHYIFDSNVSTLVTAIGSLRCPWTSLKYYIEMLCQEKCDKGKILDELKSEILLKCEVSDVRLRGQVFEDVKDAVKELEAVRNLDNEESLPILRHVLEMCDEGQNSLPSRMNIARLSPYLEKYRQYASEGGMEVFGQYSSFQNAPPDPKNHVTIVKFHPEVSVFKASNRRPVRVSLYGSNGRKYSFLVKCNEDLRQDNRIEQVLELMNHPLGQLSLSVETYNVFPLTHSLGIIEYVKDCATLSEVICHANTRAREMLTSVYTSRREYINNMNGGTLADNYGLLTIPDNLPHNLNMFREKLLAIPNSLLRDSFQKIAGTSEMFVKMRTNFIKSLAPMNIAHWILGIGDRHLSNCMISLTSGNVVGIDFGHAFGTATQQLNVPELMPFRLSPQMRGFIGNNDEIHELMWQTLNKLCQHRSLLLAAMEVFVREPTLNWIKDDAQHQWKPRHKIQQCKRKLNGADPITILVEDLQNRSTGEKYVPYYCRIVKSVAKEENSLTVDQQVDHLIKLATDDGIMSVTYVGWNPHF